MQTSLQRTARSLFSVLFAVGLLAGSMTAHADDPYNSSPLLKDHIDAPAASASPSSINGVANAAIEQASSSVSQSFQVSQGTAPGAATNQASTGKSLQEAQVAKILKALNAQDATASPAQSSTVAAAPKPARKFLSNVADKAGEVVLGALNMIGVRYKWGGNTPDSGLDCSGFVRYVFKDTLGFLLPRRAVEMSHVGERVASNDLKPGDLVFFDTSRRRQVSHVGIYIGDNKFVHSPATGGEIRIDDMHQAYWLRRFEGARRVRMLNTKADVTPPDLKRVQELFKHNPPM